MFAPCEWGQNQRIYRSSEDSRFAAAILILAIDNQIPGYGPIGVAVTKSQRLTAGFTLELPNNRSDQPQYNRKDDDRDGPSPILQRRLLVHQGFRPLAEISTSGINRIAVRSGS